MIYQHAMYNDKLARAADLVHRNRAEDIKETAAGGVDSSIVLLLFVLTCEYFRIKVRHRTIHSAVIGV